MNAVQFTCGDIPESVSTNRLDRCLAAVADPIKPLARSDNFFFYFFVSVRWFLLVLLLTDPWLRNGTERSAVGVKERRSEKLRSYNFPKSYSWSRIERLQPSCDLRTPSKHGLQARSHKREARNFGNLSVSTEPGEHCSPFRSSRGETSRCDRFQRGASSKIEKTRLAIPTFGVSARARVAGHCNTQESHSREARLSPTSSRPSPGQRF